MEREFLAKSEVVVSLVGRLLLLLVVMRTTRGGRERGSESASYISLDVADGRTGQPVSLGGTGNTNNGRGRADVGRRRIQAE